MLIPPLISMYFHCSRCIFNGMASFQHSESTSSIVLLYTCTGVCMCTTKPLYDPGNMRKPANKKKKAVMSFLDRYQAAFSHQILETPRNGPKERERGLQNICLSSGEKRKSAAQKPSVDRKYDSHKHTNRWGGALLQVPRIKPQRKTTERERKKRGGEEKVRAKKPPRTEGCTWDTERGLRAFNPHLRGDGKQSE